MFKKRKEKINNGEYISQLGFSIKPGMKLNNSFVIGKQVTNFIIPNKYTIYNDGNKVSINWEEIGKGSVSWTLCEGGRVAKIIQEDIMSPKGYDLQA